MIYNCKLLGTGLDLEITHLNCINCRLNIRKHSFSHQVVDNWNALIFMEALIIGARIWKIFKANWTCICTIGDFIKHFLFFKRKLVKLSMCNFVMCAIMHVIIYLYIKLLLVGLLKIHYLLCIGLLKHAKSCI